MHPLLRTIAFVSLLSLGGLSSYTVAAGNESKCTVTVNLPVGARLTVDGREQGEKRDVVFSGLTPGKVYLSQFLVRRADGSELKRAVEIQGGKSLRLSLATARSAGGEKLTVEELTESAEPATPGQLSGSQRWAILIGIDDYTHLEDLRYCSRDMHALRDRLVGSGFQDDHVFLLEDGATEKKRLPFKANIERDLALVLRLAEKGDVVLVAFSGHGVLLDEASYLCPTEANLEEKESLISLDKVYEQLGRSPAEFRVMLVDACRDDPRLNGRKNAAQKGEGEKFVKSLETPPKGIIVLASCAAGQQSMESEEFKNGVFMHYIVDGLEGAADRKAGNSDGSLSLLELYRYASLSTKTYVAQKYSEFQTPTLKGEIALDFTIGRVTPGRVVEARSVPEPKVEARSETPDDNPRPAARNAAPKDLTGTVWRNNHGSVLYYQAGGRGYFLCNKCNVHHTFTWRLTDGVLFYTDSKGSVSEGKVEGNRMSGAGAQNGKNYAWWATEITP